MTFDLDKLEALAKAATPGEWRVSNHRQSSRAIQTVKNDYEVASVPLNKFTDNRRREADADFIAAANPSTILALVAHIRQLEADNKDFLEQITVQTESVLFKELQEIMKANNALHDENARLKQLVDFADALRAAQRAYMADRGNDQLGRAVVLGEEIYDGLRGLGGVRSDE